MIHYNKLRNKEEKIKYLTSLAQDEEVLNVLYHSKIGNRDVLFERTGILQATLKDGFYPSSSFLDFSTNTTIPDDDDYYREQCRNLKNKFVEHSGIISKQKIMLFALAPQPLLIYLGCLFNKAMSVYPKQRIRETESWIWKKQVSKQDFEVIRPQKPDKNKELCLLIRLSDSVDISRIEEIKQDSDLWILTVNNPKLYSVTSKSQLDAFSKVAMDLYSEILKKYGRHKEINLFPVMPNSFAVEFGRVYMPKINNDMIIYDQVKGKDNKFKRAFKLNDLF